MERPADSDELGRLIAEHHADARRGRAGRLGKISKSVDLDDLEYADVGSESGGADPAEARNSDDPDVLATQLGYARREEDDFGTARGGRNKKARQLFRKHIERVTIIDPVIASIGAMRWLHAEPLTVPQICELLGRSRATVDADLQALFTRLLLLERIKPPDPALTYAPAVAAGVPRAAAAFAFWFGYTLSPERAAELSGYGRRGPTSARKHVIAKLAQAGGRDPRLSTWAAVLSSVTSALKATRKAARAAKEHVASTTLGKRRSGLQPKAVPGGGVATPIAWLDGIPRPGGARGVDRWDMFEIKLLAAVAHLRLDGNPVKILARILHHHPRNVITAALELAGRDLPYVDAFRDP